MKRFRVFFILCLILMAGLALRIYAGFIYPYDVDSDNGIIGLMGIHILQGKFPVFFYGQPYMGSLEAFVAALFFAVFGVSTYALVMAPITFSLLFVLSVYLLCRDLFDSETALIASLYASLCPMHLLAYSLAPRGGYPETLFFGTLVLWLSVRATRDSGVGRKAFLYGCLGLAGGVGWWTNNLIAYYLVTALVFMAIRDWRGLLFPGSVFGMAGFILGSLPFWVYNLTHDFASLGFSASFRWGYAPYAVTEFFTKHLPRLLDVWIKPEHLKFPRFFRIAAIPVSLFYITAFFLTLFKCWQRRKLGRGEWIMVLFPVGVLAVYAFSHYSQFGTQRYLLPLYSVVPVMVGVLLREMGRRWRVAAGCLLVFIIGFNLWGDLEERGHWCRKAVRNEDIFRSFLNYLDENDIQRAIVPYWMSQKINFLTGEKVICANPMDERYPPYQEAVDRADDPAVIVKHSGHYMKAMRSLAGKVTYKRIKKYGVFHEFQAPPWRGKSLDPRGWRATASHDPEAAGRAFDRDLGRKWASGERKKPGMSFIVDLGSEHEIYKVRTYNAHHYYNFPAAYRLDVSRDGKSWEPVAEVGRYEIFYWEGHRIGWAGHHGRFEALFEPVPARFVRIEQTGEHSVHYWEINEMFIYEVDESRPWNPSSINSMVSGVSELGLSRVYANRWVSAKIREALGDEIATVVPYNARYPEASGTDRIMDFQRPVGFFVAQEDQAEVERLAEEIGLSLRKKKYPDYVLYWCDGDDRLASLRSAGMGLLWTGFAPVWNSAEAQALYFAGIGESELARGNPERALEAYEKACRAAPDNALFLEGFLASARKAGRHETAREAEAILKQRFEPDRSLQVDFTGGIRLIGLGSLPGKVEPGNRITVRLFWSLRRPLDEGVVEFLHCFTGEGLAFQADRFFLEGKRIDRDPLPGTVFIEEWTITVPAGTPEGNYRMALGLWRPDEFKRLGIEEAECAVDENRAVLGEIRVEGEAPAKADE